MFNQIYLIIQAANAMIGYVWVLFMTLSVPAGEWLFFLLLNTELSILELKRGRH